MKLNFWQWLAIVLLIVGAAWWAYDYTHANKSATLPAPNPPSTQDAGAK